MKLAIILGTHPEIIKMIPMIRECERRRLDYFIQGLVRPIVPILTLGSE
ncbi:hypothetical protein Mpsy_2398 [Methanolobus psychrophilus R15]|nr:hypothetical protein Mpsy_2398 [Methanolobus psychrophilus R15]